jgi:hypothetical protein
VEEWDSGGAPHFCGGVEIFHAPEHFYASMTKRSTEHPMARKENGL